MKNKEEFLKKLSEAIDKIEDKDVVVDYFSMTLSNYDPDNRNNERKLCYFQAEIDYNLKNDLFVINDTSEPFKCTMEGGNDCTERGYCNGDC
jgi:hypothetical protein